MIMIIAEPIQTLEYLKDSGVFPFQYNGVFYTVESIDVAIDTMRKYRKIEEIMKETHEGIITKYQKIEEVLKDGNDN